jgi:NAD(P)-dependent dehydrogenase (short-subunit alcohol dehydrogenase family)
LTNADQPLDHKGKGPVAVITGAGSGVGRAVALALAEAGFSLALIGRRKAALEETRALSTETPNLVIPTDVTQEKEVVRAFAELCGTFGRIDVLFNNAGAFPPSQEFGQIGFEDWRAAMAVNLDGAFLCAREAFGHMVRQQPNGGRIINNGSISAHAPRPDSGAYTASKHAMTGLTKSLILDGRKHNIACSQIDIGNASTELTSRFSHSTRQADGSLRSEPMIDTLHVARAIAFVASLPLDVNIPFLTIMATAMPYIGRG